MGCFTILPMFLGLWSFFPEKMLMQKTSSYVNNALILRADVCIYAYENQAKKNARNFLHQQNQNKTIIFIHKKSHLFQSHFISKYNKSALFGGVDPHQKHMNKSFSTIIAQRPFQMLKVEALHSFGLENKQETRQCTGTINELVRPVPLYRINVQSEIHQNPMWLQDNPIRTATVQRYYRTPKPVSTDESLQ